MIRHAKGGPARHHLIGRKPLIGQPMLVGTGSRRAGMVITGGGELETAASHQNLLARRGLQLLPELVGAADERNVLWRLRVCMANDPRFTAVAALLVDVAELLEDQGL